MVGIEDRQIRADHVRALLERQYVPSERAAVWDLLRGVSCTGQINGWYAERIQLVALALSEGNASLIYQWIKLGNTDVRDLQLSVEGQLGGTWESDLLRALRTRAG